MGQTPKLQSALYAIKSLALIKQSEKLAIPQPTASSGILYTWWDEE